MTTTEPSAAVRRDLGSALGVVLRQWLKASSEASAGVPGAHRGWQVLDAAVRGEATSQTALGQRFGIDRTVLTYLLDDLERAGLVTRQPDPDDRRNRRIVATPLGVERHRGVGEALADVDAKVLSPLDAEEAARLRQLLDRLAGDSTVTACEVAQDLACTEEPPRR
ncbi:DNA-binding MarR family transcriptional regulator [Motilibacter rhizosphaerae]|uniref:DNA-binding MarR family transcriptional regulator n=1 Tax=Motilibacter rhizosphaerae TaxID=598652 RepID=A0A4Q7NWB9_9ACTN|nr:MarR family transcriptional regulator [Motilibacter rhizosphaerae]RZS91505.1 DNA-binding MarR family transcriptional regulator [Motilibacter rhizosphaerae]